jgi:hypothetical protein
VGTDLGPPGSLQTDHATAKGKRGKVEKMERKGKKWKEGTDKDEG